MNNHKTVLFSVALAWTLHAHADDRLVVSGLRGIAGGRLVSAQRTEPKTLNWAIASDSGSREVLQRLMADLIHINRATMATEAALAKSWKVSKDRLHWELELRSGIRFSDGHPFDAEDVLFTLRVILDESLLSPQRELLMLGGKPIQVRKLGDYRVVFDLPQPYSVPDRIFDGIFILPRHKLEAAWKQGKLKQAWGLNTPPSEIAGLGPFRFKEYVPGQRITLERNPYYWKVDEAGVALPYLSELTFLFSGTEDNQVMRFEAGDSDIISRVGARNFAVLEKARERRGLELVSAGSSLEYSFLFFNLSELAAGAPRSLPAHQAWRRRGFRQAVSAAIDRDAMVRLVYLGRAAALAGPVSPGNKDWVNTSLPAPVRNLERARSLLTADGFKWNREGGLLDAAGQAVEFSIIVSNSSAERVQIAAMIQDDLKGLGIRVSVTKLEFGSLLDRIQKSRDFEACILSLGSADADPNPDLPMWLSSGANHFWNPNQKTPATPWEAEIDRLMKAQLVTPNYAERKRMFDRVQELIVENQPIVPLVSPHLLAGAKRNLANFRPALIEPYTLWNVEQLYWRGAGARP
ncbi:MAG: ABC transporter substrate-binding protein [Candidatus Solibacter sp.]